MENAEERHKSLEVKTTGQETKKDEKEMENKKEKEKNKKGFDKELVLKKMEKFLKSVQSEKDENKETETSSYIRRKDHSHRNLSKSDKSDTEQSSIIHRSLSSKKRERYRKERTRTRSRSRSISGSRSRFRSTSRERRHHKKRERSDDSYHIHHSRRVNGKEHKERRENENEKDKLQKNYDRINRYEESDQHDRYDRQKRYEHRHRKESLQNSQKREEGDRRDRRMDRIKTSSYSSDRSENDKYTYKERRRRRYSGDSSPSDRKKELERTNYGRDSKYPNQSKYVYNKYTGDKIETKFFRVPLGFHVTKENWETYTKWLKQKNKYRFDIPFDQHKIYRRSSSLSPNAWEEFINDSEASETEEETLEKDTPRKGRHKEEKKKGKERDKENIEDKKDKDIEIKEKHKKERKKSKRRDKKDKKYKDKEDEDRERKKKHKKKRKRKYKEDEDIIRKEKLEKERKKRKRENSEENTVSSSESYDSLQSTNETKKRKKREHIKMRKKKKHYHKKKASEEKKRKREKERKGRKRSESKKRKTIKETNKRKKDIEQNSTDLEKGSISSSITSVSFLNEEMELEDEVFIQGKVLKEDKTKDSKEKNTSIKGANKDNIHPELEEKEEHFSKRQERSLVKEDNETNQKVNVQNDLKEMQEEMSDDESDIGPTPLDINVKLANKPINYGVAMMPGEGEAIAQFVQKGKRIPRRGEVGLSAEAIENYEKLGYVMSGSRHKRMNAIRMRKENQVYSVEEQRALAMYNYEERAMRENALINDLKEILRKQNETIMNETKNESN